jgi:hypothetical protein
MKQHGHGTEKHSVPETGCPNVPSRDQLSVDNGAWLNMEHNTSAYIIPLNAFKQSLVSLHVTLEDFEHGCELSRCCKKHQDQCLMHRDQKKELE